MDNTGTSSATRLRALPSWIINQVAITANRLTDRALADTGSRRYHFAMLAALDEYGPSSQADLGRCTGIDRSDVVTAVNDMVERGLLRRRPDPADARRNIITVTAAGRRHLASLDTALAGAQRELLHALSPAETETLMELLTRVLEGR
jgi:MarR family transcriptional regulator, lower aerobic nicotinate degradation pathway regulator